MKYFLSNIGRNIWFCQNVLNVEPKIEIDRLRRTATFFYASTIVQKSTVAGILTSETRDKVSATTLSSPDTY